ncbi:hypothetical protein JW823_07080 [bacterium]|nr:hypothetical protein [candidate division CSSED10-310 bacterium]
MKSHGDILPALVLSALVTGIIFFPALFLNARSLQWDALDLHYPHLAFFSRSIESGIVPLWEPHLFCGYPFAGYLQSGVYYPINFAASLLMPITPRIVMLLIIIAFGMACMGLWLLGRRLGLSRPAASIAAVTWVLSGQMLGHTSHVGIIQIYAAFPWVLLIASRSWEHGSFRYMALSGIALGWSILAGHFQSAMYCFVFWLIWLIPAIQSENVLPAESTCRHILRLTRSIAFILSSALLCLIATGIQLITTADLALQSQRSSISMALAQSENLYPESLMTVFVPDLQGGISGHYSGPWSRTNQQCYAGMLTPLLWITGLVAGLVGIRKRYSGDNCRSLSPGVSIEPANRLYQGFLQLFLAFFSVLGILFALGPLTPVHDWALRLIPGWNLVRTPSAILPLVYLALAILAGTGLDWIASLIPKKTASFVLYGLPLLTFLHLVFLYWNSDLMFGKDHPYTHFHQTSHRDFLDARYREASSGFRIHEWDIREVMLTNEASWKGWYGTGGRISGLHLKNMGILLRLSEFKKDILDILRVRYILMGAKPSSAFVISTTPLIDSLQVWHPAADLKEAAPGIRFNPSARGLAFPVTYWELQDEGEPGMERLLDLDLNRQVMLDEAPRHSYDGSPVSCSIEKVRYDRHSIDFSYTLERPAILVMGDTWTTDWKASIDGVPTRLYRADMALRAIEAPAGQHTVRLRYAPFSYLVGVFLWLSGVLAACWLLMSFPSSNSSQKCHKPGS